MFDDLGLVGSSHRGAKQDHLARLTLPPDGQGDEALGALQAACGFAEMIYLATCNRVEVLFVCQPGVSVAAYRERLRAHFSLDASLRCLFAYEGEGALERFMLVAASLDSMSVGDAQILGQCKQAVDRSRRLGLLGPRLGRLAEAAFSAAKRVRTQTHVGRTQVSVLSLLREPLLKHVRARGETQPSVTVAWVGVGDMTRQAAGMLQAIPNLRRIVVNRTLARAEAMAPRLGAEAMALNAFLETPPPVDVLVTSTASPDPLFTAAFVAEHWAASAPMLVDLGLPRDIAPDVGAVPGVALHDLDSLQARAALNRDARAAHVAEGRALVDDALDVLREREGAGRAGAGIRKLRASYEDVLQEALQTLPAGVVAEASRAELEAWAQRLVNRLLHVPTVGLRRLAHAHGAQAVDAFVPRTEGESRGGS